jgi:hydroxyacylglutathione hydrolase
LNVIGISALKDNYIWALVNEFKHAWVVDPGEPNSVINFLHQADLKLQGILLTHHHGDHTGGVSVLKQLFDLPVYGSMNSPISDITHRLQAGERLALGQGFPEFEVMAIPGHTLDHIAYYAQGFLFCGDTLFAAGCGRIFEGTREQMYHSLQKLAQLPPETKLYCGHEYTLANLDFARHIEPQNKYILDRIEQVKKTRAQGLPSLPSTLLEEKQTNPFLRCEELGLQKALLEMTPQSLNTPVEVFGVLRELKNSYG